ncbi:MAG: MATE family efflux transporter [Clostridia bacterium]
MSKTIKNYIGDKKFYKHAFMIILPIMAQQLFLSIAGYVDSLMINSYGGNFDAFNGVSAANRLMFIFQFVFIGLASAASIFISQYYGAGKKEKVSSSFSFAIIVAFVFGILSFIITEVIGDRVVDAFLTSESARQYGYRYLDIMGWGSIITSLNIAVSSSFRSIKRTVLPMVCGIIGIVVNICLNYTLIFGHFGFAAMDATGAAIATIISRAVELVILLFFAIRSKDGYFKGFYKFKIDKKLIRPYIVKGSPLVFSEILWSLGIIIFTYFYTYKNDLWYNAYAYSQNISDLFFIIFAGLGNGTAIIIGAKLGANDFEGAKRDADRMKGLSIMLGAVSGILMVLLSPVILQLFNPTPEAEKIVIQVLIVTAFFLTIYAYNGCCFFIMRAGGDSLRTFILDQGATYLIAIPIAIVCGVNASAWGLTLPMIFLFSHIADVIKIFVATKFVHMGKWIVNLTKSKPKDIDPTLI